MKNRENVTKFHTSKSGLLSLMGQNVAIYCNSYIYSGKLKYVSSTCIELESPFIVYETGPFTDEKWKDAQSLNVPSWFIQRTAIESFGRTPTSHSEL